MAEDDFHQQGLDNLKHGCNPEKDHVASYENFSVFSLSQYQYIILLIAFAKVLTFKLLIKILERSINIQYFSFCIPNPASLKILTENLFT